MSSEADSQTPESEKRKFPGSTDEGSPSGAVKKLRSDNGEESEKPSDSQSDEKPTDSSQPCPGEQSAQEKGSSAEPSKQDSLGYAHGEFFTSEIFKIRVTNLPQHFGFAEMRKRFEKELGLKPHKIKSTREHDVAYICFKNEEEKQMALGKLNGLKWKGCELKAEPADPVADPYYEAQQRYKGSSQQKKKQTSSQTSHKKNHSRPPLDMLNLNPEEAERLLKDNVTPFWEMDYPEQLETKTHNCEDVLRKLLLHHFVRGLQKYRDKAKTKGMACPLMPIVPAPATTGYRNKNEFGIGYAFDGKTLTVGFRYGMYKNGSTAIGNPKCLTVTSPKAIEIAESFAKIVVPSGLPPYQYQTMRGHWQTLVVRTFTTGDTMIMVDFVHNGISEEKLEKVKTTIKEFYTNGEGKHLDITCCYIRRQASRGQNPDTAPKTLLFGNAHVYESILGQTYRVSPEAFFQINTLATEKLYSVIMEWSGATKDTTILDLCCGTGTIGLSMAKKVKEVIGIDNCLQAIEDAKENASLNDITNTTYYCSKVEDVIGKIMTSFPSTPDKNLVAIVDPPRAGLHKSVVKVLRKHYGIQRLLFVSCNPELCTDNFADLIRLPTNNLPGIPFSLVRAIPVDLFPGTRHVEVVLLFERDTAATSSNP